MLKTQQNHLTEWSFTSGKTYAAPLFQDFVLTLEAENPS